MFHPSVEYLNNSMHLLNRFLNLNTHHVHSTVVHFPDRRRCYQTAYGNGHRWNKSGAISCAGRLDSPGIRGNWEKRGYRTNRCDGLSTFGTARSNMGLETALAVFLAGLFDKATFQQSTATTTVGTDEVLRAPGQTGGEDEGSPKVSDFLHFLFRFRTRRGPFFLFQIHSLDLLFTSLTIGNSSAVTGRIMCGGASPMSYPVALVLISRGLFKSRAGERRLLLGAWKWHFPCFVYF